ncbi:aromatic ring-opening dioxygenase LigA [Micromonospora echinofusca]|uniref:aromatic ring-opening dioxygenase LigA n=1 Tax=Micromonospora echinofusca TaxID=47858 RepID=UPI000C70FE4C|nr:aromatic ring-opening dioxygenase LigA [Micromonospora sp. MSM11]MCL7460901.1 aromatic ring-opening dioxygenase LigA [Micromonospora sp. MSM11]
MSDTAAKSRAVGSTVRLLSVLVIVAGLVMLIGGAATWFTVQSQLADERITVSADADWFAGEKIDGPLTAYAEAEVIEKHSLEASGGKTYAELGREDPTRQTVMNGSFLRASLFTSVVSFGVAALAMGLGVVLALIGYSLLTLSRRLDALPAQASTTS